MAITIGQFLGLRTKNADTAADPYNPPKESFLELNLPEVINSPVGPAPLPPPPAVAVSTPASLPPPPNVSLGHPSSLPPPPAVVLSSPSALPPVPAVVLSSPSVLPPEPAPPASTPAALPPEPPPPASVPAMLPPPPAVVQSAPAALPPPPTVQQSVPGVLPPEPPPPQTLPAQLPPAPKVRPHPAKPLPAPPPVVLGQPGLLPPPKPVKNPASHEPAHPATPVLNISSGYAIAGEKYSPVGGAGPGELAADPFMYERQLERGVRLGPGKVALHSMIQVGMFAQNVYGNIWNPAMLAPPPIVQNMLRPALDLTPEGTAAMQVQISDLVDKAYDNVSSKSPVSDPSSRLTVPSFKAGVQPIPARLKKNLAAAFDKAVTSVTANGASLTANKHSTDALTATAFENGIIPMRLKGDNDWGFRTFEKEDKTDDDDVYVPLSFTDLRPVGNVYRSVYFRPLITSFSENFSPEWNKTNYMGRVDPVMTYQSTGRSINLGFRLIAFAPEDITTIYQKLHWLQSMVYPSYDKNLMFTAGPVVRLRIGDVVNGTSNGSGKGLPGVIESLDFDYSDSLWELKKGNKVPRNIEVSLTFTVIHDVPVGLGNEGMFGGLGKVDEKGKFSVTITEGQAEVDPQKFRNFGKGSGDELKYTSLQWIDIEEKKF